MKWTLIIFLVLVVVSVILFPFVGDTYGIALFGNVAQIISLIFASISLYSAQKAYSTGDAPKRAWRWLAAGIWIWLLAMCVEAFVEIILKKDDYGSPADVLYIIGYFPLILGLFSLIKNYRSTDLPMGSRASYVFQALLLAALYIFLFKTLIQDSFNDAEESTVLKFLDVAYPTLDFLLIALSSVLIRISWVLRGGSLARSWILLCLGFALTATADIILGYVDDPFLDILYFSSYFLIALSGISQIEQQPKSAWSSVSSS